MEKNSGFKITAKMAEKLLKAIIYGDLLQKLLYKNRPYEIHKGETKAIYEKWLEKCKKLVAKSSLVEFKNAIYEMVNDFEKIPLDTLLKKPKVGIVGEILIKYHPFGNNFVVDVLEREGAEVIVPDFMGFVKYFIMNKITMHNLIHLEGKTASIYQIVLDLVNLLEKDSKIALEKSKKGYMLPVDIKHLEKEVNEILSSGNQTGEGWFLTAEMIEYIENDIPNIVCVQPFACLPNHVVGKGVIKTIREKYPYANISPIDYDPGASETNQENRIKLLTTVAKDNLKRKKQSKKAIEFENLNQEEKTTIQ